MTTAYPLVPFGGLTHEIGGLVPAPSQVYLAESAFPDPMPGLVRVNVSAARAGPLSASAVAMAAVRARAARNICLIVGS